MHNRLADLSNITACYDSVVDASGVTIACKQMGDMRLLTHDHRGREFHFWLRGVRYSPDLEDSLVSVDQLWHTSNIDSVFRDVRSLILPDTTGTAAGEALTIPFKRRNGLFCWDVGIVAPGTVKPLASPSGSSPLPLPRAGQARGLKSGIHAANARSHVHALPADDAAATLHRRLHVSLEYIRRLGARTSDAPKHVASASRLTCAVCAEANSTSTSHGQSQYAPTHAGRLVHADIVGPFTPSFFGGSKYGLILVDDHTRFKFAYFMKAKSEAPAYVNKFIASLNAHASSKSASPVRVVGSLHIPFTRTTRASSYLGSSPRCWTPSSSPRRPAHLTCTR